MNVHLLSKESSINVNLLGGKGANLVRLLQLGVRIPDCIAITTEGLDILGEGRLSQLWKEQDFTFAAVRSSATVEDSQTQSFAGMFSTFLYVTEKDLINKIKQCTESLRLPRITQYRQQNGMASPPIKMAVLVQKMVNSESSGVCFTRNPVTGNSDEIVIEAIFGQGELLVSGQVTPDSYTISKKSERIITKRVQAQKLILTQEKHSFLPLELKKQNQQKLSDFHILLLTTQAKKIEQAYGAAVDIEWAVEKGKLYFLQVRPITT